MSAPHVIIHCNAGPQYGMGHLMRSLALADEAVSRGWTATIGGDIDAAVLPHVRAIHPGHDLQHVAQQDLHAWLERVTRDERPQVVHLDTYAEIAPEILRPLWVSNMQDGDYGVRAADLAIDSNLGAESWFAQPRLSRFRMLGVDVAVVRAQVLAQRDRSAAPHPRSRVLVVIGGTDPGGLTATAVEGLLRIDMPLDLVVVARPDQARQIVRMSSGPAHRVEVVPFLANLPSIAREQDLVVSAAGTSVWDFACMGVPMALVCAVDNQRRGYQAAISAGMAHPLGEPPHDRLAERASALGGLLLDRQRLRKDSDHLRATVDGRGAWRIVSAWEDLSILPVKNSDAGALRARPARADDARLLLEWRNDPAARRHSRSKAEIGWDEHVAWLRGVLGDQNRRLLIVEDGGVPIATARWDRESADAWEISVNVAPAHRGRGTGAAVVHAAEDALSVDRPVQLRASIHIDNPASRRLFLACGYLPHLPADADGFETRVKWLLTADVGEG